MMINQTLSIGILKNDLIYILLETDGQKQDKGTACGKIFKYV